MLMKEKSLDQKLQSKSSIDCTSTFHGSGDTEDPISTPSKISASREALGTAINDAHSSESGSGSDSVHITKPTRAPSDIPTSDIPSSVPIEEHTTPIGKIDIQDKRSPLAEPTSDEVVTHGIGSVSLLTAAREMS
jgi:hypothetical protein